MEKTGKPGRGAVPRPLRLPRTTGAERSGAMDQELLQADLAALEGAALMLGILAEA